jgi:hypothetical protein
MIKYLMGVNLAIPYALSTGGNVIDANGATVTTMTFATTGNSATLMWYTTATKWYIVGSGVTLS